jgi:hypothetical protein
MKYITLSIWTTSLLIFVACFYDAIINDPQMTWLFAAALAFLMPISLYSWLLGKHKGALQLQILILIQFPLALACYFRHAANALLTSLVFILYLLIGMIATFSLRKSFPDDFK